jgi:hypothetical protein
MIAAAAPARADEIHVKLSGDQEAPPVTTAANGSGTIKIGTDKTISGSIKTSGVKGTMAHVHVAPSGQNGPVAVPLVKSGDDSWSIPANSKLTDEQYVSFKSGNLYINVHSDAHPGGEIRAQLKP